MVEGQDDDLQKIFVTSADQEKPPINKKYLRLYGHHLCPFVEKARLTLAAKAVPYQSCELDLSKKTQWHIAINDGKVPVIELTNGTIINESKIIMEYLEEAFPESGVKTLPEDPAERALLRLSIPIVEEAFSAYYGLFRTHGKNEEDYGKLRTKLQKVEDFLNTKAKDKIFAWGTDHITQLDIHFYPHLARIAMLKGSAYQSVYEKIKLEDFPRIIKYVQDIQSQENLKPALTQLKPNHLLLEEYWAAPDGVYIPLKLPVQYD